MTPWSMGSLTEPSRIKSNWKKLGGLGRLGITRRTPMAIPGGEGGCLAQRSLRGPWYGIANPSHHLWQQPRCTRACAEPWRSPAIQARQHSISFHAGTHSRRTSHCQVSTYKTHDHRRAHEAAPLTSIWCINQGDGGLLGASWWCRRRGGVLEYQLRLSAPSDISIGIFSLEFRLILLVCLRSSDNLICGVGHWLWLDTQCILGVSWCSLQHIHPMDIWSVSECLTLVS